MARPVGIRQVAERAGVSVGTVSNVLNRPGNVSSEMSAKVLAVMNELGFVRNDLARQLRMGQGTTIGMIVLNMANPFFGELAHACELAAEELGHTVLLGSSDQLPERENRYIDLFEEQRVRGMIIAPLEGQSERMVRLRDRGVPLVLLDVNARDGDFCSVALDGRAGGYLAARHLIDQGRRHILFVGGPVVQVQDRLFGAMRACAEASGVRLSQRDTPDQTIAVGRAEGDRIASLPPAERPDAVFAANDLLALGVMQSLVLHEDISVPRDVAIVGYDDIEYAASAIVPLSTIRQPKSELAEAAIRLLLEESSTADEHKHQHLALRPELIVRQSSL